MTQISGILNSRGKVALVSLALALVIIAGASLALAQTNGTITACVKDDKLKSIGIGIKCRARETPLEWSIAGEPGPQGPPGPPGPAGTGGGGLFLFQLEIESGLECTYFHGSSGTCDQSENFTRIPKDGSIVTFSSHTYRNTRSVPASITLLVNGAPSAFQLIVPPRSTPALVLSGNVELQAGDMITVQSDGGSGPSASGYGMTNIILEYRTD